MRFDFHVRLNIPDEWQGPGHGDKNPDRTAEALAAELRHACARIVPTIDSSWYVQPMVWSVVPAGSPITIDLTDLIGSAQPIPIENGPDPREVLRQQSRNITPEAPVTRVPLGGELERAQQIHVDARGAHQVDVNRTNQRNRMATCPVCWERYPITDDPTDNHHRAMLHKTVCRQTGELYSKEKFEALVNEHDAQPHVQAMHQWTRRGLAMFATAEQIAAHDNLTRQRGLPVPSTVEELAAWDRAHLGAGAETISRMLADALPADAHGPRDRIAASTRRWWQFWRWFD